MLGEVRETGGKQQRGRRNGSKEKGENGVRGRTTEQLSAQCIHAVIMWWAFWGVMRFSSENYIAPILKYDRCSATPFRQKALTLNAKARRMKENVSRVFSL